MISSIRQSLSTNWHFARILRLVFAVWIAYSSVQGGQYFMLLFAALFAFQAITNTGCCGVGGCSVPTQKATPISPENPEEVTYEEVK